MKTSRLALAALLNREMDAIFKDLLDEMANVPPLGRQRATAANRVVLLCRSLAQELQRYEHLRWLVDAGEEEEEDEDPIDF